MPLGRGPAFLNHYYNQGDMGGVILPLDSGAKVGEQIDLEIEPNRLSRSNWRK